MVRTHVLGYPRIGPKRELKFALESHWRGESSEAALAAVASSVRHASHVRQGRDLAMVTAGDFAYYDLMLEHIEMFGCAPLRFAGPFTSDLERAFALARGTDRQPPLEMTKWFDTNYHYLVPELDASTTFRANFHAYLALVAEAQALGHPVKPVLIGPLTFLWLSKSPEAGFDRLELLPALCALYGALLNQLDALGIEWVQLDEPALALDLPDRWLDAVDTAYAALAEPRPRLLLTTYFGRTDACAARLSRLPVDGIHLDLVRAPEQLGAWLEALPENWVLSAGIVDGRNVWRTDLDRALALIAPLHERLSDRLWLATSCSLLHAPLSVRYESALDAELLQWLAFADEKIDELRILGEALNGGPDSVRTELDTARTALATRRRSARVNNPLVQHRLKSVDEAMTVRRQPFGVRIQKQQARLNLPPFPTTTIGSFPQTADIRKLRADYKRGALDALDYLDGMREQIALAVKKQEAYGLDVLVHGEAERNDMVEYFAELLWGFAFTSNGWVQSYGSRCVKPPIIYGDVYRPAPMTVEWTSYAQSLTSKPLKGMLTGPVTMLQWSFVRDDQPRSVTATQIALALRQEVLDLEAAGIGLIQIDEPALREGLPLKRQDWSDYLAWAVRAFRLAAAGVSDGTQIHSHMCYAEFQDILPSIAALDADVITIETSRSDMKLLDAFGSFQYPNQIGPGLYDIHSPRIPSTQEMSRLLRKATQVIPAERLWVNPDCGLKTRGWAEVDEALQNMVQAARLAREGYAEALAQASATA